MTKVGRKDNQQHTRVTAAKRICRNPHCQNQSVYYPALHRELDLPTVDGEDKSNWNLVASRQTPYPKGLRSDAIKVARDGCGEVSTACVRRCRGIS